jgi:serine/threonine protein kinase
LIDENNTAIVTDFGLSKAKVLTMMNPAGAPTLAGRKAGSAHIAKYQSFVEFSEVAGTPSYLAPELWRNESYSESVDVYSFGVVLWELLARDAPYRELSNEDLVFALRDNKLRPPIPKWTPEAYKLLTERCWSEVPTTRPNFDQVVKLLKILEEKHIFQWTPPDNYSLDEEVQHRYLLSWKMERESKDLAMMAAEKKLLVKNTFFSIIFFFFFNFLISTIGRAASAQSCKEF